MCFMLCSNSRLGWAGSTACRVRRSFGSSAATARLISSAAAGRARARRARVVRVRARTSPRSVASQRQSKRNCHPLRSFAPLRVGDVLRLAGQGERAPPSDHAMEERTKHKPPPLAPPNGERRRSRARVDGSKPARAPKRTPSSRSCRRTRARSVIVVVEWR